MGGETIDRVALYRYERRHTGLPAKRKHFRTTVLRNPRLSQDGTSPVSWPFLPGLQSISIRSSPLAILHSQTNEGAPAQVHTSRREPTRPQRCGTPIGLRSVCSNALESDVARKISGMMNVVSVQRCPGSQCTSRGDLALKIMPFRRRPKPKLSTQKATWRARSISMARLLERAREDRWDDPIPALCLACLRLLYAWLVQDAGSAEDC
jgi:hypothetical protein